MNKPRESGAFLLPFSNGNRITIRQANRNMEQHNAPPELQALASKVFKVAEWLCGDAPVFNAGSGWYKIGTPIVAWFRLIGPKARTFPANSIQVAATKNTPELAASSEAIGNNMFGEPSPECIVQSSDPTSFASYLEFIARAYKARSAE